MKHEIILLEGECDLEDDPLDQGTDFSRTHINWEKTDALRAKARAALVRLDPEIVEFFKTTEAINDALRRGMREMQIERRL